MQIIEKFCTQLWPDMNQTGVYSVPAAAKYMSSLVALKQLSKPALHSMRPELPYLVLLGPNCRESFKKFSLGDII